MPLRGTRAGTTTVEFGATVVDDGVTFRVFSRDADVVWLCLFDEQDREISRQAMDRAGDIHTLFVPGAGAGARYGYRAEGAWQPQQGLRFDRAKLLLDPYATRIDRAWRYDERLALAQPEAVDTAGLVPKAIVEAPPNAGPKPLGFSPGGLIYEINVRGFSMRHPDVPAEDRGRLAALAHPAVIAHLRNLGVDAVELMPVAAWIDERHLAKAGLRNAWGYNPVNFFALDPRLAPNGMTDLARAVAALHEAGIAVILDVVYNHTGEGDEAGPTLSFRGLDNRIWYRHERDDPGKLVNDTGCGNTIACDRPVVRELILASLRHFAVAAGIDGFRFDLATTLGRDDSGFAGHSATLAAIAGDPVLADRVLIAEPWDIGPGGYRLGSFGERFLEWNDRYRDGVRRFWAGTSSRAELASRLAGSSDIFLGATTRSVNFVASHDGFALADIVTYARKHNEANGEDNRDGHDANHSWNHGVEGPSDDPAIRAARKSDVRALLTNLFASRGTLILTAGDEFGRTQAGNNNAYAQDNEITWLDWDGRDRDLERFVGQLSALRRKFRQLGKTGFFTGDVDPVSGLTDVEWLRSDGDPLDASRLAGCSAAELAMLVASSEADCPRIGFLFNRSITGAVTFRLKGRPASPGITTTAPPIRWKSTRVRLHLSSSSDRVASRLKATGDCSWRRCADTYSARRPALEAAMA